MSNSQPLADDGTTVQIAENGAILTLDYAGARAMHGGDSWWGVAVGFRAMQVAASSLSQTKLWHRDRLNVVSGHPGPGVRDAIDYVTRCVEHKRFRLSGTQTDCKGCSRDMKFEWWLSDGEMTVAINLRPEFVPEPFYQLLDRLGTDQERAKDRSLFDDFKAELEARIWRQPLSASFETKCSQGALKHGDLP